MLSFDSGSLNLLQSVNLDSQFPAQMAFYTDAAGVSRLFVAAPLELVRCGSRRSRGAILVYAQRPNGTLVREKSMRICSAIYNVIVANGNLYWSGDTFGGYSLKDDKPLLSPTPPLPMTVLPNAMSAVMQQRGNVETGGTDFEVHSSNGAITIFDGSMKPLISWAKGRKSRAGHCIHFDSNVYIAGKAYRAICWDLIESNVEVYGITRGFKRVDDLERVRAGKYPVDLVVTP